MQRLCGRSSRMQIGPPPNDKLDMILEEGTSHALEATLDERLAIGRNELVAILGIANEAHKYEKAGGPGGKKPWGSSMMSCSMCTQNG